MIDHTLVKPTVTKDDVIKLCWEAEKYGFCCAAVNPTFVSLARCMLEATDVKVCSTVGFPFGVTLPEVKAFEARKVMEQGAEEIDMVMNVSALKSKDHDTVKKDIEAVISVKRLQKGVIVKVIIETAWLTKEEKISACNLVKEAGADFVKTSTGFFGGKATVEDIRLMRQTVGKDMGVKAAAGIRTLKDALAMVEAGANRLGTSTAVQIIEEISK
jgi:deoxyribose-phosphate aldolase